MPPRSEVDSGEDVVRLLEAAAHEAPPSPRADTIRQALLDDVSADRPVVAGLVPLAIAATVLLLALLVGIGAPSVGSWLQERLERAPTEPQRLEEAPADPSVTELPLHADPEIPTQAPETPEAADPIATPAPVVIPPSEAPAPTAHPAASTPSAEPGDVPAPTPTGPPGGPPRVIPTAPAIAPPSDPPGG